MNRRNFALSWGRKLFFGISWPLTTMLALIYFRSFIFPQNAIESAYFAVTYIGHFGLLNAIAYFLIYCPIVLLIPGYYVSRIWSLLIILALNIFILSDALSFSSYHHHIYSFLWNLYLEKGFNFLFGSEAGLIALAVGMFILAVLIWIRGEMIWRHMQTRFSNPVKNWYLVIILICVGASHAIYNFTDLNPKYADFFPVNFQVKEKSSELVSSKFYYPSDSLQCQGKNSPNLILITLENFNESTFNEFSMPLTLHLKKHSVSYNRHYSIGTNSADSKFALMYSIPASYSTSKSDVPAAIYSELEARKYEILNFQQNNVYEGFKNWIDGRSGEEIRPYFMSMHMDANGSDQLINDMTIVLQKEDLLQGTYIVITGVGGSNTTGTVPFIMVTPDRRTLEIDSITTHYDVLPTLMQRMWNCKKVFKVASIGESLDSSVRDWVPMVDGGVLQIRDFKNNNVTSVVNGKIQDSNPSQARHELIFPALKVLNTSFRRP